MPPASPGLDQKLVQIICYHFLHFFLNIRFKCKARSFILKYIGNIEQAQPTLCQKDLQIITFFPSTICLVMSSNKFTKAIKYWFHLAKITFLQYLDS